MTPERDAFLSSSFTAEELARVIGSFCNRNSNQGLTALVKCLMKEHPTLQQRFTLIVDKWFEMQAADHYYDQRTESTVALARAYLEFVPAQRRYFPCI